MSNLIPNNLKKNVILSRERVELNVHKCNERKINI